MDNNNAPAPAPATSTPATEKAELLAEFLVWLDRHTDTMDPLMIQQARDHGRRHLAPDHVADLVTDFLQTQEPCTTCGQRGWHRDRTC